MQQIHGFTGSSEAFKKIVDVLAVEWRVIIPDLRGHGKSSKPKHGFHVFRLAMDLKNLIDSLHLDEKPVRCLGASLGCAVIWFVLNSPLPLMNEAFSGNLTFSSGRIVNCLV
jgi:pimeloyl-ACP methyl ester carboxylesterase